MRGSLTHRAVVQRSGAAAADDWGRPGPPAFQAHATLACRAWSKNRKEVRDDGKEVLIEDIRALFAGDADIQTGDRVTSITDRRSTEIFSGPLAVQTVARRGQNVKQLEVMLTRNE